MSALTAATITAPEERTVRLSQRNFDGKSVTAVAVAAHEVGHALQHKDNYAPLMLRQKLDRDCHHHWSARAEFLLMANAGMVFA